MSSLSSLTITSPAQLRDRGIPYWKQLIVSGLFTGLSPIASGTVGSAVAALFYFIPGFTNPLLLVGISIVAFVAGLRLAGQAEEVIGDDPSFVTLDEFAGQWLALASPWVIPHPYWVVLCFFVFRAFDIAKVWPASHFDRQRGAMGIMADDMVAGLYANIASHLIWFGLSFLSPVIGFMK
jgi:phosphatidylglycerophosphatase A